MAEPTQNEQIVKDVTDLVADFKTFKDKVEAQGETVTKAAFDEFATKMNAQLEAAQKARDEQGTKNVIFGTETKAVKFFDFLAHGPCQSDAKLKSIMENYTSKNAPLNATTNTDGKYLVPAEYANDLTQLIKQQGIARSLHNVIVMSEGGSLDFPTVVNEDDAYFQTTEGQAISNGDLDFGHKVVTPGEVVALLTSSNKLVRQSRISVAEIIAQGLTQKASRLEDRVTFNGDGVNDSANGGQTGYGQDSSVTSISVASGSLELKDLAVLMNSLPNELYENDNSAFYMSRATYNQFLTMKVDGKVNWYGLGQPSTIKLDANGRPTIYGKSIQLVSALPSYTPMDVSESVDDIEGVVLYGDLRSAGRIVTVGNFAVEASTHVLFKNAQTVWRMNYDFGFGVVDPNSVVRLNITA